MTRTSIYLDAQATEKPRPQALAAITHHLTHGFGNPSATAHDRGRSALARLENARSIVASHLGACTDGVIFCSGASEANNLFLKSLVQPGGSFVASAIEHKSVLQPGEAFSQIGTRFLTCDVDTDGRVDLDDLRRKLIGADTVVSIMHANNETGVIQPIRDIAEVCRDHGAILHVDAAQTVGKIPVSLEKLGADALTVSGHKFGGPVGSGALIVKPDLIRSLVPLIIGGGQEAGIRAGTTPIALIAGMSSALDAAIAEMKSSANRMLSYRDTLMAGVQDLPGFFVNGTMDERLACNFSGGFEGVDANLLMRQVPTLQMSAGSACTTGRASSHVLEAMGVSEARRRASLRLSISWSTSKADIAEAIHVLRTVVPRLSDRASSA
ncbi:cysteine desulfurase family protein [Sulfitobacter sp. S190]|uniref:cysteine desulfurase family protein n=1 Tax=Sulfitobacter sp. S190 TaxID=2867022 RepID=UPI0021A4172D|nr:cysteine desulfurase family protein [Sulfitobacter sp. S190]UWR24628.1 cysteine desulfurase [Sulfitobacter sp. S190]